MDRFDITDKRAIEEYVVRLEKDRWRAMSSSAQEARAFYAKVLDGQPLMLLPGSVVLDDREAIIGSVSRRPVSSYDLDEAVVVALTGNVAVISYGVVAHREGAATQRVQVSSTYVRRAAGWKLALLQEIPRDRIAS